MIYVKDNKTKLCKGDYRPAQFYKGNKKIAGYEIVSFEGERTLTLENCYNDRLYNAKIYGNENGVGDLMAEGEHIGKYRVGAIASGKNLIDSDLWLPYFDKLEDDSYKSNQYIYTNHRVAVNIPAGSYTISIDVKCEKGENCRPCFYGVDGNIRTPVYASSNGEWVNMKNTTTFLNDIVSMGWYYSVPSNKLYFKNLQIEAGDTATEFEEYKGLQTVDVYLDSPLNSGEYIDFERSKVIRKSGEEVIELPVLPTIKGTTVYQVDTEVFAKISGEYKKVEE